MIATAEPERAIGVANKAVHYLFNKSMMSEARQLGELALDRADEPRPETRLGRLYHTARALVGALVSEPKMPLGLREALVRLYPQLFVTVLISDLSLVMFASARLLWLYRGLRSGATATARSFVASILATLGQYHQADKIFSEALDKASMPASTWEPSLFAKDMFLQRLSTQYFRVAIGAQVYAETHDPLALGFSGLHSR